MIKRASGSILFALSFFILAKAQNIQSISGAKSPQDDANPVWIDESTIFFTRAFHPLNKGGLSDAGDIWMIQKSITGVWQKAIHRPDLSSLGYDVPFGLENPNSLLIYHQELGTKAIFQYSKQGSVFVRGKQILIANLNNFEGQLTGSVTADGQLILLAGKGEESKGNEDLYFSEKTSAGTWTLATNMGSVINTKGQELGAFYDPKTERLFFSSNMQTGAVGKDIFTSKKLKGNWKSWSSPLKWEQISTQGSDISVAFSPNNKEIVWTSILNSDGFSDLMTFNVETTLNIPEDLSSALQAIGADSISKKIEKKEPVQAIFPLVSIGKPEINFLNKEESNAEKHISLYVVDSISGKRINFSLYAGTSINQIEMRINNNFQLTDLISGGINFIKVTASNYDHKILTINELQKIEITKIGLVSKVKSNHIEFESLIFERGKFDLEGDSFKSILFELTTWLIQNPEIKIRINGHTDVIGDPSLNKLLSLQRASTIRNFLIDQGIPPDQLRTSGWGGSRPIAPNDTEVNRGKNRRVEICIEN